MTKKLWGGRFSKKTNPLVEEFTKSIQYDYKLAICDVLASQMHIQILLDAGLLSYDEEVKIFHALKEIANDINNGKFKPNNKKIENKYLNYLRLEEKKRGCGKCPARNQCSKCPFLGNIPYKTYCKIKRKYSARIDKLIALLNIKQYGRILTE